MSETSSVQNARARARARRIAPPPAKPRIRVMARLAPEPEPDDILPPPVHEDDEAPFDPPDHVDLIAMGAPQDQPHGQAEEETEFAAAEPAPWEDLPDFVTPEAELTIWAAEEEAPVIDPPPSPAQQRFEQDALALIVAHAGATAPEQPAHEPAPPARSPDPIYEQPVPPIVIHGSWDRPEIAALLGDFAADRRMARANITLERGGLDAALARFAGCAAPDLLILDSTLRARELLAGLDKLVAQLGDKTKIFVVGAVNDIGLLRDLAARGVKYVVPPLRRDDLARAVCGLYAEADTSRVIAVIGGRGGVGASTLAYNLAWSIAEHHGAAATLIDLDLAFGAAAFSVQRPAHHTVADIAGADPRDTGAIERAAIHHTPRLQILAAPADLQAGFDLDPHAFDALLTRTRRATSFVVLDLPHAWNGWVRRALTVADDVLIVASPDLASLRNADNMLKRMKEDRATHEPLVVLSMTGVPKRPEIPAKDFAQALGAAPVATLAYEPALFGAAALAGQIVVETAPQAKAARTIDALAGALTGLPRIKPNKKVKTLHAADHAVAAAAQRAAPEAASDEAPLELVAVEESDLAQARAASANDNAGAPQRPQTRPLRVAIYCAAIILLSVAFRVQADRDAVAEAHVPPVPTTSALDPVAEMREAQALLAQGRHAEALTHLRPLGERGFAPAQYALAKAYERGQGVAPDRATARRWTERAASGGDARAMHDLGVYYASGEGDARDDAAAFRWFRQAAEFNLADSQYNLGILYEEGRGVAANPGEALFWFLIAARQGDADAQTRAAALQARMSAEQISNAQARAEAFRPRVQLAANAP